MSEQGESTTGILTPTSTVSDSCSRIPHPQDTLVAIVDKLTSIKEVLDRNGSLAEWTGCAFFDPLRLDAVAIAKLTATERVLYDAYIEKALVLPAGQLCRGLTTTKNNQWLLFAVALQLLYQRQNGFLSKQEAYGWAINNATLVPLVTGYIKVQRSKEKIMNQDRGLEQDDWKELTTLRELKRQALANVADITQGYNDYHEDLDQATSVVERAKALQSLDDIVGTASRDYKIIQESYKQALITCVQVCTELQTRIVSLENRAHELLPRTIGSPKAEISITSWDAEVARNPGTVSASAKDILCIGN